tara:strand:+ start:61 stop:564 length:504 start_codon:yes stop_codon:yes gene_type:complete
MFLLIGCQLDTHNNPYDSPFDIDASMKDGVFPPALTLYPKDINVNVGESAEMSLYIIQVNDLSGANAIVNYDFTKLTVVDVKPGDFFESSQSPLFVYDDNEGVLSIFTSYLGLERKVSGSGNLAIITFESKASGTSTINFSDKSELVDKDDFPIAIKGFGQGTINAK